MFYHINQYNALDAYATDDKAALTHEYERYMDSVLKAEFYAAQEEWEETLNSGVDLTTEE